MEIDLQLDSAAKSDEDATTTLLSKWWLPAKTADERIKLRERNLEAFKQKYISVYEQLVAFKSKSDLVFDDDGEPDMVFAGTGFYDGNIVSFTEQQLKKFWRGANRWAIAPPQPGTVDAQVGRMLHGFIERTTKEAEIVYSVGRTYRTSFYGIIQGIGLGRHIPEFIERTECRNLFFLEPNFEGFYHSLELLDWQALMLEMQDRNGDVFFYVSGTTQNWMDGLRAQTRATNPNSIDGTYVYAHYNNPMFLEFSKKFSKESQFLMTGLGFFYDEQIMLRNTYHNMAGHNSRLYLRAPIGTAQETPAIIVGCGPSLDKNIEDIRRNADNAVIFSCGSALGPLMDAGIRPDFQMELENIDVMRVMQYAAEKHDLSGICLVASSTVEREIKDFFSEVVYYFRPALCPYPVFSNNPLNCLAHPDPTVVNVGLSFAQEMGFLEFYLFGTDLGQKDSDQHHAKSSFHYSDKAKKDEVLQVFNIEVPANFGGKAMTSSGLFWALDTLQRAILYTGNRGRYYNCSNGARINRAIPKLSRTLNLEEPAISRSDTVRKIVESFPEMTAEDFSELWQPEKMIEAIDDLLDELIDITETHDLIKGTDHLIELARLFYSGAGNVFQLYAGLVLRGSINQAFIAGDYYLGRVADSDKNDDAMRIFREEYATLIEHLRKTVTMHIRSQGSGLELAEEFLRGDTLVDGLSDAERERLMSPSD